VHTPNKNGLVTMQTPLDPLYLANTNDISDIATWVILALILFLTMGTFIFQIGK
jgi:hypothetical protein